MTKDQPKMTEEYKRFQELTKKLVSVPKKDVQDEEKKFKKSAEKKKQHQ
jgi:hypothetical protein